jgi:hypothetical protein
MIKVNEIDIGFSAERNKHKIVHAKCGLFDFRWLNFRFRFFAMLLISVANQRKRCTQNEKETRVI